MATLLSTPLLGANVDRVTAGTTTDGVGSEHKLGTQVTGADGVVYQYVQAGEAISTTLNEPYALGIDENFQALKLTATNGLAGHRFGVAPRQIIADNAFFWARVNGPVPMRVTVSAAADVRLGIGGVGAAGRLMSSVTASAGNMVVEGCKITAAASASTSAGNTIRTAILAWPVCTTAVAD
jgi:hypothetical protein